MKNKFRTLIVVICLSYYCPGRSERAVIFSGFLDIEITRAISFRGGGRYVTRFHVPNIPIYSDIIVLIIVKTTKRFFSFAFLVPFGFLLRPPVYKYNPLQRQYCKKNVGV